MRWRDVEFRARLAGGLADGGRQREEGEVLSPRNHSIGRLGGVPGEIDEMTGSRAPRVQQHTCWVEPQRSGARPAAAGHAAACGTCPSRLGAVATRPLPGAARAAEVRRGTVSVRRCRYRGTWPWVQLLRAARLLANCCLLFHGPSSSHGRPAPPPEAIPVRRSLAAVKIPVRTTMRPRPRKPPYVLRAWAEQVIMIAPDTSRGDHKATNLTRTGVGARAGLSLDAPWPLDPHSSSQHEGGPMSGRLGCIRVRIWLSDSPPAA